MRSSLLIRVALIALASGLLVLLALVFGIGALATAPTGLKWILVVGVIVALPLALGWLTRLLVMRPLQHLSDAIASLESKSTHASLHASGINEFDTVLARFDELTQQLHREEALRKNLISDTSHELNTPLTAMTAQLVAMQDGKLPLTKQRIGILRDQTDRLTNLVSGLDAYSRARLPRQAKPQAIPIKKMCQQLIDQLAPRLKEQSLEVVLDIPAALTVKGDPQAFQQIRHNWLENVLRYSEAKQARIIANPHGLTLIDNGRGVPDNALPHLFERFYRVEKSRNPSTGGLGLGLAIVQELVERQGWQIHAEAAHPGLTFIITFEA